MNRVERLIQELCPDGVEYRAIGEVVEIFNGKDHKSLGDGNIPVFGSGGVMRKCDTAAAHGPAVLIPRKGSLGNIFYVEGPFWIVDTIFRTTCNSRILLPKFFYYLMVKSKLETTNEAGGVPSQTQTRLKRMRIPVPPLAVQREIVRILDKFTALEAELEAELEARRKQYDFYRSQLILPEPECGSFRNVDAMVSTLESSREVEFISVGSILRRIPVSKRLNKSEYQRTGAFPVIDQAATIISAYSDKVEYVISRGECIIFGDHTRIIKYMCTPFIAGESGTLVFETEGDLNTRYIFHALNSLNIRSRGYNRHWKILKDLRVPIPTLEEQKRIADILDRFDALVNDISIGLPAELEARRKQYEYYRDKLLTFKELSA